MNNKSARALALDVLIRISKDKSYSNISLNQVLKNNKLNKKDKAFITQIVYGTIQYRLFLEYQVKDLLKTKIKEQFIFPLLWMSIYQLVFLDRVPDNAVLDEANKLAKQYGQKHSGSYKLVNAVLRSFLRRGAILPKSDNIVEYLSIKESFPKWLVKYLIDNFTLKRTEKILTSLNQPAKNSVRMTVPKTQYKKLIYDLRQAKYDPQVSALTSHNLILDHGGIADTDFFKNGELTIQDAAASLVVDAFDFSGKESVLDACSAPGGKTAQIAEHLTSGNVLALDLHAKKLHLVMQNAERLHVADKIKVKALDARKVPDVLKNQQFDKILVDAPCSGLGLLRRKPEIRYTKDLTDIRNLAKIQGQILDSVSQVLKPGGELVYSTCTITKEEDENVIAEFLKRHQNFELLPINLEKIQSKGTLKILPDTYGSDGFFIAKLRLRG